jgi:hypothetical protein
MTPFEQGQRDRANGLVPKYYLSHGMYWKKMTGGAIVCDDRLSAQEYLRGYETPII